MKKLCLVLAMALLVAGCKKKEALAPVRVYVDDFTITQDDFPTREDPTGIGDYSGVKAITLAFYTAGELNSTRLHSCVPTPAPTLPSAGLTLRCQWVVTLWWFSATV